MLSGGPGLDSGRAGWLAGLALGGLLVIGSWRTLVPAARHVLPPPVVASAPMPAVPVVPPAPQATEPTDDQTIALPVAESTAPLADQAVPTPTPDVSLASGFNLVPVPAIMSAPGPVTDAAPAREPGLLPELPVPLVAPDVATPAASNASAGRGRVVHPGAVPILMYHYIRVNPVASDTAGFVLSVTPADFAAQVQFLADRGYTTVTMAQVREYLLHGVPLPPKPIALTFDDGYDDAYTAARPVLERYHETATFYIVTGFVNRPHYVTWDQVVALDRGGMEIASHTVTHNGLTYLNALARRNEVVNSRATLEETLGHPVLDFCYPGGQVDAPSEIAVRQAGYLTATTTASGFAAPGDDLLRLPRLRISGGLSLAGFAGILGEPLTSADRASAPIPSASSGSRVLATPTATAPPHPAAPTATITPRGTATHK